MSKKEFLAILRLKLSSIHAVEQEMFISFYDEIIQDMMENGMTEEEAVAKQGDIGEIARNILADIGGSKETKKKAKKYKNIALIVLAIIICLCVYTCIRANKNIAERRVKVDVNVQDNSISADDGTTSISYTYIEGSNIDVTKYDLRVKEILKYFNDGNYKLLADRYASDNMKQYFKAEVMDEAKKMVSEDFGKFKSYGQVYASEVEQDGVKYVLCSCACVYENVTVTYSITFTQDNMVDGFYLK